jgi:predicted GIY-YIG superfamily endonuclease
MPFSGSAYSFTWNVISTCAEVGAVYGLFTQTARGYACAYVGQTDNLRRRLQEHLNNPPVAGVTHFFAEGYASARDRANREAALITEFQPRGNTVGRR